MDTALSHRKKWYGTVKSDLMVCCHKEGSPHFPFLLVLAMCSHSSPHLSTGICWPSPNTGLSQQQYESCLKAQRGIWLATESVQEREDQDLRTINSILLQCPVLPTALCPQLEEASEFCLHLLPQWTALKISPGGGVTLQQLLHQILAFKIRITFHSS